jgi:putative endonuclease
MDPRCFVYILTNARQTVLYTGVTGNLKQRVFNHRTHVIPGFTSRYNVDKLVFCEEHATAASAIAREKQLKGGSRRKQVALIDSINPDWRDLCEDLL